MAKHIVDLLQETLDVLILKTLHRTRCATDPTSQAPC